MKILNQFKIQQKYSMKKLKKPKMRLPLPKKVEKVKESKKVYTRKIKHKNVK